MNILIAKTDQICSIGQLHQNRFAKVKMFSKNTLVFIDKKIQEVDLYSAEIWSRNSFVAKYLSQVATFIKTLAMT